MSDLKDIKDMVKPICEIKGSWLKNLIIDNKVFWDIDQDIPDRYIPNMNSLAPSDWRYREDLIWLKYGYQKIA